MADEPVGLEEGNPEDDWGGLSGPISLDALVEVNKASAKNLRWKPWHFRRESNDFDQGLIDAIKDFQWGQCLPVTGIVDDITKRAYNRWRFGRKYRDLRGPRRTPKGGDHAPDPIIHTISPGHPAKPVVCLDRPLDPADAQSLMQMAKEGRISGVFFEFTGAQYRSLSEYLRRHGVGVTAIVDSALPMVDQGEFVRIATHADAVALRVVRWRDNRNDNFSFLLECAEEAARLAPGKGPGLAFHRRWHYKFIGKGAAFAMKEFPHWFKFFVWVLPDVGQDAPPEVVARRAARQVREKWRYTRDGIVAERSAYLLWRPDGYDDEERDRFFRYRRFTDSRCYGWGLYRWPGHEVVEDWLGDDYRERLPVVVDDMSLGARRELQGLIDEGYIKEGRQR